jgi:hypothetical protein
MIKSAEKTVAFSSGRSAIESFSVYDSAADDRNKRLRGLFPHSLWHRRTLRSRRLHAPMGQFVNIKRYPPADFRGVSAPNADTAQIRLPLFGAN